MSAFFVTATGTDIGKTFVTAGLVQHWRTAGQAVEALKPVITGFDPAEAEGSDGGLLLKALGHSVTPENVERISPWRYTAPLSPDVASRRENRSVPFDELVAFSRRAIENNAGKLLIEGVGGIMVPLEDRHTVLDWMTALDVPLVLVAGSLSRHAEPHAHLPRRTQAPPACRKGFGGERDARLIGAYGRHDGASQMLRAVSPDRRPQAQARSGRVQDDRRLTLTASPGASPRRSWSRLSNPTA